MRILSIASEGPPTRSGIARSVAYLESGLEARGHAVDLVAYPSVPRLVVGEVRLSGLVFQLRQLMKRLGEYDVVHVHGEAPTVSDAFLLALPPAGERPPVVYTHHCDIEVGWPLHRLYNAAHHRLSGRADEVVTTTRGYGARRWAGGRVSVIPLGVDAERFRRPRPKDAQFTVLFVGQFRPYKGVPVLLEAMAAVRGARLLVAGRGPEEQHYRAQAEALGLDVEFHVTARDAKVDQLYERAHAVVLPSVTTAEAFGLVLLEGMAAGCVPVASDLPGVREVLGRIGLSFPVGSAADLAATLRRLRDDPAMVSAMGVRARARAAEFSWDRTVEEYDRLFGDLVVARALAQRVASQSDRPGTHSLPEPLDPFEPLVRHLRHAFDADHAQVLLDGGTRGGALIDVSDLRDGQSRSSTGSVQLARYSYDTGESIQLPARPVPGGPLGAARALASAPLLNPGGAKATEQGFGALVVTRAQPFEQREVDALTRLARHVAPSLWAWQQQRGPARFLAAAVRPRHAAAIDVPVPFERPAAARRPAVRAPLGSAA